VSINFAGDSSGRRAQSDNGEGSYDAPAKGGTQNLIHNKPPSVAESGSF
jgi:hypothetical protein